MRLLPKSIQNRFYPGDAQNITVKFKYFTRKTFVVCYMALQAAVSTVHIKLIEECIFMRNKTGIVVPQVALLAQIIRQKLQETFWRQHYYLSNLGKFNNQGQIGFGIKNKNRRNKSVLGGARGSLFLPFEIRTTKW
jgi:hypothetical protein